MQIKIIDINQQEHPVFVGLEEVFESALWKKEKKKKEIWLWLELCRKCPFIIAVHRRLRGNKSMKIMFLLRCSLWLHRDTEQSLNFIPPVN
jgi:hypothetical protein